MKTLTLCQPWATLVALGAKRIETRSWATAYRGPLAIHAAKGRAGMTEAEYLALARSLPHFGPALRAGGYPMAGIKHFDNLPRGAIVAACDLVHCEYISYDWPDNQLVSQRTGHHLTPQERAFGDYSPGRWAWLLSDVRPLPEPIPTKGALGLWEWTLPEGVEL